MKYVASLPSSFPLPSQAGTPELTLTCDTTAKRNVQFNLLPSVSSDL